ncbi:hypothetical protein GUJ93_ZPchr0004g40146 [Zizania palustris]|uniref:Root cap protein 1 n=1 Tax=Zizania palustris TaxID=103762 RepID=A0A8J5VF76_ZIZPA|nr:hypothetical protein GUJ93_ZPchr0004g40146 [Zizania palustris]
MASVRPCTAALRVATVVFLVAAASAQSLSPGVKPTDPILTNPDVIPIYMSPSGPPTVVSCYNHSDPVQDPQCTVVARECPRGCRDACYVHCPSCKLVCLCDLTGTGCYDPRFVGGDGNKFLFHGRKDADFCLLSDANMHINAHFIGKRNAAAARDFTWVQPLGIRFGDHCLYLRVRRTVRWDAAIDRLVITFDGAPVELDVDPATSWSPSSAPALSIFRSGAANGMVVRLDGRFRSYTYAPKLAVSMAMGSMHQLLSNCKARRLHAHIEVEAATATVPRTGNHYNGGK